MFWKILIVGLILLLLFGGHRLGSIGQNLGQGIKNFKKALRDDDADPDSDPEPEPKEPKLLPPKGGSTRSAEERVAAVDESEDERKP